MKGKENSVWEQTGLSSLYHGLCVQETLQWPTFFFLYCTVFVPFQSRQCTVLLYLFCRGSLKVRPDLLLMCSSLLFGSSRPWMLVCLDMFKKKKRKEREKVVDRASRVFFPSLLFSSLVRLIVHLMLIRIAWPRLNAEATWICFFRIKWKVCLINAVERRTICLNRKKKKKSSGTRGTSEFELLSQTNRKYAANQWLKSHKKRCSDCSDEVGEK